MGVPSLKGHGACCTPVGHGFIDRAWFLSVLLIVKAESLRRLCCSAVAGSGSQMQGLEQSAAVSVLFLGVATTRQPSGWPGSRWGWRVVMPGLSTPERALGLVGWDSGGCDEDAGKC